LLFQTFFFSFIFLVLKRCLINKKAIFRLIMAHFSQKEQLMKNKEVKMRFVKASKMLILTAIVCLFGFLGCETEKIVETIVKVEPFDSIAVIVVDSDLTSGKTTKLTADVTVNAEYTVGSLTYYWAVSEGMLSANRGDTVVWTAPAADGEYTVTVHVSDGTHIGQGSGTITVGAYQASITPAFVGVDKCVNCHNGINTEWSETAHAFAWDGLMTSDHAASYCNRCHTVDFAETAGNGGFDDEPTAKFQNVQCESCHGPSSEHVTSVPNFPEVSINSDNCTTCHSGEHHPYSTDWDQSPHAFDALDEHTAHGAPTRAACAVCHSGSGFIAATGTSETIVFNAEDPVNVSCAACHDPHSNENPAMIRTLAPVNAVAANGVSAELKAAGTGQLCVQCHRARSSADTQIDAGYIRWGTHSSPQGDFLAGTIGYEDMAPGFQFGGKMRGHYMIENSCASCHMEANPYPQARTGHTFAPTTSSCKSCHGEIADFNDLMANGDYDGDGAVEGFKSEIEGLMNTLASELHAAGLTDTVGVTAALTATNGDTSDLAIKLRKGGWNYTLVENDGSMGIHNPTYAVQILQQSILFLNQNALKSAAILRNDDLAVAKF
jgi:hypothetical protein